MGMTIEKAHEILSNGLVNAPSEHEWCIAFKMAIDTMRKYQKIQKILNSASYVENGTVYSYTYDEDTRVKHIREVVEDGNNN